MDIAIYTLSFIIGIVIGVLIIRIIQLDAEQKEFDKQNKNGNITLAVAPRNSKARANEQAWRDNIINNEGKN